MAKNKTLTKDKKIYYRRADFGILKVEKTLQAMALEAFKDTDNVGERTFSGGNGSEVRCSHYAENNNGLCMQITTYTPGQPTSTIETDITAAQSNVDQEGAPKGKDYVDGEVFVFINDNDIVLTTVTLENH